MCLILNVVNDSVDVSDNASLYRARGACIVKIKGGLLVIKNSTVEIV